MGTLIKWRKLLCLKFLYDLQVGTSEHCPFHATISKSLESKRGKSMCDSSECSTMEGRQQEGDFGRMV